MNQQTYRAIGIGGTAIAGALLLGITNAIFEISVETNLFSTGITPGQIFGIMLFVISYFIYKNKI